jgi:RimJ/RimL family protein N-acetyltransferase
VTASPSRPSTSVSLRALSPTDQAGLDAALSEMAEAFLPTYPWFRDWLLAVRADLVDGRRVLYSIDAGETSVGLFLINDVGDAIVKANAMVIRSEFRGRGYSLAAYRALFAALRGRARLVFTQCKVDNFAARRLIDRSGFRPIGRLHHDIEASDDNVVFVRELEPTDQAQILARARDLYSAPGRKQFIEGGP